MQSKQEESPVAGPLTHVEPTNGFPSTVGRWHGCSEPVDQLHQEGRATTGDSATEQSLIGRR